MTIEYERERMSRERHRLTAGEEVVEGFEDIFTVIVRDESGNVLTPKHIKIEEDGESIWLIQITLDNADMAGKLAT